MYFKLILILLFELLILLAINVNAKTINSMTMIASQSNTISPALDSLIDKYIKNKKSKEALNMLDDEILKSPKNIGLLLKKAELYADQEKWNDSLEVLNQIKTLEPDYKKSDKLLKTVLAKKLLEPKNEIGIDIDEAYVSDLAAYWNYTSVHYYRLTDCGKFGGHINYANRYQTTGVQYQLEAYPKISKNIYASLSFAYANSTQRLYPSLQYLIEFYFSFPKPEIELSLGQSGKKFIRFSNQKIFDYTGSIGKYLGNYFIWFRPHYSTPKNTKFYELGLRRYFSDSNNFISLQIGAGKLPDIGDVPPLDQMIVINQKGILLIGQFSLSKCVFVKLGGGYVIQHFPNRLRREITDGSIGLIWQF